MRLLGVLFLAFQAGSINCQYYDYGDDYDTAELRPNPVNHPVHDSIGNFCPEARCNQFGIEDAVCQCKVTMTDNEQEPVANGQNKVRVRLTKKMCWERNPDDDSFYENCEESAEEESMFEDRIEICYEDNIDAAQAMCRQFNKGDAFGARAHPGNRKPTRRIRPNYRTLLAKLVCPQHAENLESCSLELLPAHVTRCTQMVAHCWFSPCWQPQHTIRATLRDGGSALTGAQHGRVIYGQACKLDERNGGICGRHCFRCPDSWVRAGGDRRDGERCFAATGGNVQGELTWEPHFRTLDGKHFDFQGRCSYYLIKNAHFSIIAKFGVCGKKDVTCVREITINSGNTQLRLGQGNDFSVKYRGRTMRRAKKPFHNGDVNYYLASSEFDAVDVWNGFKILWDRKAEYKTVMPDWNVNSLTRGLLGNKNGNPDDDMIKPNGELTTDPLEFGNSWMVPGSCPPGVSSQAPPNIVLTETERSAASEAGCKHMNPDLNTSESLPDPFKNCTSAKALLERKERYEDCLLDMDTCYSNRDPSECLCPSFEFLADYCESEGEGVGNWRARMPNSLCRMDCDSSKGEVFRMDADPCTQTCDAIKYIRKNTFDCIQMKVEGCNCIEGKARDRNGNCIPIASCR